MITDYGSAEYDANSALAELDKALRSNNIGEKAEIIVKVPIYFEKYPFPVFVNSIFLKLTEVFRSGTTNFLRKCVLQVAERSETHLDKIISRDEIAKRILTVSYSNDPIARSLTLRLLGCLSCVFKDLQQIHHLIRTSLDSRDSDELQAAIFAAERFAQHSDEFSTGIYDKVAEMLLNDEVQLETKIDVIPVFQHMHTDSYNTDRVLCLCKTQLLPKYHQSALICAILRTLTGLALSSLTIFSSQIELLLDALNNSKSFIVKRTSLSCLENVTKTAPHFWTKEMFQLLCDYIVNINHTERNNILRLDVLKVLLSLSKNKIIAGWNDLSAVGFQLLTSCSTWISLKFDNILSSTCEVLANIITNGESDENMEKLAEEFFSVLTKVIPIWNWKRQENDENYYSKKLLRSVVILCKRHKNFASPICRTICRMLNLFSADKEPIVFETLFALYDCEPSIVDVLRSNPNKFDAYRFHFSLTSSNDVEISSLDDSTDGWRLYKLGRFASRYGKHAIAAQVFRRVETMVVSDYFYHWTKFLADLSTAEHKLASNEIFSDVISLYIKSSFYLKAAVLPTNTLWFQIEYVMRKIEVLKLIDEIRTIWNVCRINPPPTVAVLSNNRSEKAVQLINQFASCAKSMSSLADKYQKLLSKCFDADSHSLDTLRLEQTKCSLIEQCLILTLDQEFVNISVPETECLNACCKLTADRLNDVQTQLINLRKEPEKLTTKVIERVLELIDSLARQPTYMPRYFFQAVQTTALKLVVSPQPNSGDISINLTSDQRLAMKVEGVVHYSGSKTKKFRRVNEVVLHLTTDFGEIITDHKGSPMEQQLEKSVKPHNDYFSAEFVLQIPQSGVIFVRANVVDDVDGRIWDVGVEEQLRVKVIGHAKQIGSSSLMSNLPRTAASPIVRT